MKPWTLLTAMLSIAAVAILIEPWQNTDLSVLTSTNAFLMGLAVVAMVTILIVSHARPTAVQPVVGGLLLIGFIALAPTWFTFTDMMSGALTDDPLLQTLMQLSIPLLIVIFVATMAKSRVRRVLR